MNKKVYFYEKWHLVVGVIVMLEILNLQVASYFVPEPVPMLGTIFLCVVLFMYLGQVTASYRAAQEDKLEQLKAEQAKLSDVVAMLKRDIDSTHDNLQTSIFYANNKVSDEVGKTAKTLKGLMETQNRVAVEKAEELRAALSEEVRYITGSTVLGLQAKTSELKESIEQAQVKNRNSLDALERAVAVIAPRLATDISGISDMVGKEIASHMDLATLRHQISSEVQALSNMVKDNHISALSVMNAGNEQMRGLVADGQQHIQQDMSDRVKALGNVIKDNHIATLSIINGKNEDMAKLFKDAHTAALNVARDNHLSAMSIINGAAQNTAELIRENYDRAAVLEMQDKVEAMRAAAAKLAEKEDQRLQEVSQIVGAQSFRTETLMDSVKALQEELAAGQAELQSRWNELEIQLASVRGLYQAAGQKPDCQSGYRTEMVQDAGTGLTMNKHFINDGLVFCEMMDGNHVKYDVNYNEAGGMVSSRSYDEAGHLTTEMIYNQNGKVSTKSQFSQNEEQSNRSVVMYDAAGNKVEQFRADSY